MHIRQVKFDKDKEGFPYHLPFFGKTIDLNHPIIFIVGDNGLGKSTWVELLALKLKLIRIYQPHHIYDMLDAQLKEAITSVHVSYQTKPQGIFFGSEDVTSYIHFLENEKLHAKDALKEVEFEYAQKSAFSKNQAAMPHQRTLYEIEHLYERDLLKASHGEAYLDFFQSRIRPNYLYILDEPETPLSIQNQFALMLMIKDAIQKGCQFIISTHSPILTAYPEATIYEITQEDVFLRSYEELSYVSTIKDFLNDKNRYIHHLFSDDNQDNKKDI